MEQQAGAPFAFCCRPPSCLALLMGDHEEVGFDKVDQIFNDEARHLQSRLREQLSQLRIELGLFLRLMYKNKNQHRRTLYYQRLSEVRRDLQMLSKSGLDETVESFAKFFTARRPDGVSFKARAQFKFKDSVDESKALRTLLSVARVLNQSDGPIMAGSAQLAGLLGQSFFMPFALTMFSCLARFRVLLMQVLYEVVTAFNLLSTVWQKKQKSLIYSVQGESVSASVLGGSLPAELECQWDGVKLIVTEKRTASVPDCRRTIPDVPTEPSQLWFVDDRTGVKCELQVLASTSGPSGEQLSVQTPVSLDVNGGKIMVPEVEEIASSGPILEVRSDISRLYPKDDITGPYAEDSTLAKETRDGVIDFSASNLALGPPAMSPMIHSGVSEFLESRESSGEGQLSFRKSDYRPDSRTSSVGKKSVAYRSISHKIVLDSTSSGNSNLQTSAKRKGVDIGIHQDAKSTAKSEFKKTNVDSVDRRSESEIKEKKTKDIFAMLLGGSG